MKVSNLENHSFSLRKTHISQKSRFTNYVEKTIEKLMSKSCKNRWKIHPKLDTKSRCRKVSENDAKMSENVSKMEPQGIAKVDKIDVNFEA